MLTQDEIDDWYFDTVLTTLADLSRLQTDTDTDIVKVVSENRSDLYLTELDDWEIIDGPAW